MSSKQLLRKRKHKQRLQRLKILPIPTYMAITNQSATPVLATAYALSIYWDNSLNQYLADLADFGGCQLHADTWDRAAAAGRTAHTLLIEAYRAAGYQLPEV